MGSKTRNKERGETERGRRVGGGIVGAAGVG